MLETILGLSDPVDAARDVLATGMRRPVVDEAAFERARVEYDRTYGRAYAHGRRHSVDVDDDFQAHREAQQEALEAFLAAYLKGSAR